MSTLQSYLSAGEVVEFFRKLFAADDFMARWSCGQWTGFHGWTYIVADLMVFAAYFTIPALMYYLLRNKESVPFKGILILFILFIFFCGSTHLMDAIIFWYPAYRLNGFLLICTAVVSWITVGALIKTLPVAFRMKTTDELELILNNRTAELQHQKENLEDFAQIISHNLRSPIASFTSLIELYDLKETPAEKEEIMTKFKQVLSRMNRSIDNMSEVVNWQLGVVQSENLSVREVAETVISSLKALIEENQVDITVDLGSKQEIHYPRIYMESIFLNLLTNSIKYRHPDRRCEIRISYHPERDGIILTFTDNGQGIDLDRFGHKLFQINQTFHSNENARGIGLYLVKKHVEQLGGSIEVDSEPGAGTTFRVQLKDQS